MSMQNADRRGLLIILSSPSGAGKSTLARRLMAWDDTLKFSVSATTRAMRPGEVDGQHYHFMDDAQFRKFLRSTETHFAKLSLAKMQTDGYRSIIAINCELSNENPAKPIEILERN